MSKPVNIMATISYAGFCLIFGGSIGIVRRRSWQLFKICHHFGIFLFIAGVCAPCYSARGDSKVILNYSQYTAKLSQHPSTTVGSLLGSRHWYIRRLSCSHLAASCRLSRCAAVLHIYDCASPERTFGVASRSECTTPRPYWRHGARCDLGGPSVHFDNSALGGRGLGRRRCKIGCQGCR